MVTGMLIAPGYAAYSGKVTSETSILRRLRFSLMLDRDAYPDAWFGSFYQGRWIVEPDIGSIKCTLGLEHLRGQSPEVIEREIWTAMMTYTLVRLKMQPSGYAAEHEIRSMSFTETYPLLATNWLPCACVGANQAMATSAQAQDVCAVVGSCPDRSELR